MNKSAPPKRQCFVGLFDILGFKDLVKNHELDRVWRAYDDVKTKTSNIKYNLESLFQKKLITIDNFSDTFLIYTADHSEKENKDEYFKALMATCDALFHSANTNELPIRGAITVGELIVNDGVHIGKPIIDAYEMEQKQEWIGCWISDDVINALSSELKTRYLKGNNIIRYKIPLKSDDVIDRYVFNWVDPPFEPDYDFGVLKLKKKHDWRAEKIHRNTREYIKYVTDYIKKNKPIGVSES